MARSDGQQQQIRPEPPGGGPGSGQARALHVIGDLLADYPGITSSAVAGQVSHVLHAAAVELENGRPVPIGVRRAVRGLADELRRELDPRQC